MKNQRMILKGVCHKCGAINGGKSRYVWFVAEGKKCCGHCGAVNGIVESK
jgi:ribosomal protein L40E